jgi:exodeoxyribonuclease-3
VSLRLLSYNIRHGGLGRESAIAAVIRACDPDIVVLQEAVRLETVQMLASLTGLAVCAAQRGRSLACLGRLATTHRWRRPLWSKHAVLELTLDASQVRIFGVHLSAVHAAWTERRRTMELRGLLRTIRETAAPRFHVLVGDFNTLAPGEKLDTRRLPPRLRPFIWLSGGSIRWRTVGRVLEAGYADAWRIAHPDDETAFTFPTWDPHLRLDYAFVPAADAGCVRRCEVIRSADAVVASDHFPLLAELDFAHMDGPAVDLPPPTAS